jgi:hypothetical protein
MRQAIILILLLSLASMADSIIESVLDRLTWPNIAALGITLFAGLLIYTIKNAQSGGR